MEQDVLHQQHVINIQKILVMDQLIQVENIAFMTQLLLQQPQYVEQRYVQM